MTSEIWLLYGPEVFGFLLPLFGFGVAFYILIYVLSSKARKEKKK